MKRVIKLAGAVAFVGLAVGVAPHVVPTQEPPSEERPAVAYLSHAGKLEASYRKWEARHEANGGDRRVTLALGWSKGLSAEFTRAEGEASLDLIRGAVSVEVRGLLDGERAEVWLVDNQPGPGDSVMPEPGDKLLYAGRLRPEGHAARLEADLGSAAFADFEVDLVVVARPGGELRTRGILFGVPRLFQRLYTRGRLGRLDMARHDRGGLPSWWGRPLAHASPPVASLEPLVRQGAELFFNETFNGNGRTCGTCHPANNNFTIDAKFIATLPPTDPLFVAEFVPALSQNFENPKLMRQLGLILENVDGFDDLETKFVMRGVPHTLALSTSLGPAPFGIDGTTTPPNQRTGWSGDGAPGGGTLREFAIGAVTQHFTRTLTRELGVDFRLPNDDELDAMEAFQLFLGRDADLTLPLALKGEVAKRGQEIFLAGDTAGGTVAAGKCNVCHANAGANVSFLPGGVNFNFDTGVEQLPDQPADLVDPAKNPPDGGFGTAPSAGGGFGNGTFNTPPLVEAADTGPFFHNNAIETIEEAVNFYNSLAFNNSPGGRTLAGSDTGGIGIKLEPTQVQAVAAFLRVLNALENIRAAHEIDSFVLNVQSPGVATALIKLSIRDHEDAVKVLEGAGLHPRAVSYLKRAIQLETRASKMHGQGARNPLIQQAIAAKQEARGELVNE